MAQDTKCSPGHLPGQPERLDSHTLRGVREQGKAGFSFSAKGSFKKAVGIGGTGLELAHIGSNRLSVGVNRWDCVLLSLALC